MTIHDCPFLDLQDGLFACTIYETRPRVCRHFEPGSSEICPQFRKRAPD
jgi:Fe-S-cluster containining protein